MRIWRQVLALVLTGFAPFAQAQERVQSAEAFIASLIAERAAATAPADLTTKLRLELAAQRYEAAGRTADRLARIYRTSDPPRASALVPWRIYARARALEAAGAGKPQALARAFAEIYAALPDRAMANVLPWFNPNMTRLREAQTAAYEACGGAAIDECARAADLIAARQAVVTWDYLLPAAQPLIAADLERRFIVERDLTIETPDGARISALLIRPRPAAGVRLTSLLNFTIYARDDWALSDAAEMAAHGYAGMVAYSRGKAASPGPITPYEHDGADAAAVIEWLAAQTWSDGRVGMFSGSYNASVAWSAAARRPPALRAIATNASNAPGIDTPMQGGVFLNFMYPWPLYTADGRWLDEFNYGDSRRWSTLDQIWYRSGRRYRERDLIDGHPNPVFRTWLDHPTYDEYWRRLIPYGDQFVGIDIPVFVQTGYFDGGAVGALYYLREHYRHRPDADHRLLIGPYHHFAMNAGVLNTINGYEIDPAARLDLQEIRLQWFDHVFREAPLPDLLRGRINYQVMGANRWRRADSIDAMANDRMRLYLTGERRGERLRFADSAPTANTAVELVVNFADRSDWAYEAPVDRPDTRNALVFETAAFEASVDVVGAFRGAFNVVANNRDFDLEVSFFEERANGVYAPLASYLGRASLMDDRSRRRLLEPGRARSLAFESQTLTARRIERGSRIVAVVAVPRRPDLQINYGAGRDVSDESIADAGEPLRVRLEHPSFLELGVQRGLGD
jgi:uncharacterized protein